MKIIEQSFDILSPIVSDGSGINEYYQIDGLKNAFIEEAKLIEIAGRTAYKSEDKITPDSYDKFIRGIISRGHEAVIEFGSMAVKFVTDRGVSHELVRHRMCSFLQESTRYCNYGGGITVVAPSTMSLWPADVQNLWIESCRKAEREYMDMLNYGLKPQQARAVLPNSLKTEIVIRANFREWRHIFKLRCAKTAHPDMQALMIPLRDKCIKILPCVFADLVDSSNE
jgi:thymidylate synthase (FAD)